jgi:hypothetical protein
VALAVLVLVVLVALAVLVLAAAAVVRLQRHPPTSPRCRRHNHYRRRRCW